MKTMWTLVIVALVAALSDICASENDCDVNKVKPCYDVVTHFYEGLGFPLYGQDEEELDETCTNINVSYECMQNYEVLCRQQPECDTECEEMVLEIGNFSYSGLYKLQVELCDPASEMRKNYLDNYVCLEDNSKNYAMCHNDSLKSQNYMSSITDKKKLLESHCCYLSWFQGCFYKATATCDEKAKEYVSFGLFVLVAEGAKKLCKNTPVECERPPLPEESHRPEDDSDEYTSTKPDKHVGEPTKGPPTKKSASNKLMPICPVFISIMCMLFSKLLFIIH